MFWARGAAYRTETLKVHVLLFIKGVRVYCQSVIE